METDRTPGPPGSGDGVRGVREGAVGETSVPPPQADAMSAPAQMKATTYVRINFDQFITTNSLRGQEIVESCRPGETSKSQTHIRSGLRPDLAPNPESGT